MDQLGKINNTHDMNNEAEEQAQKLKSKDFKQNIELLTYSNLLSLKVKKDSWKKYIIYPEVPMSLLKAKYEDLTSKLNIDPKIKTAYEKIVIRSLKANKTHKFYTSFWIGGFNVDIFFPSIKGEFNHSMKGLALEIDGKIHDRQAKMNKDNHKIKCLASVKIGVTHIENEDVFAPSVLNQNSFKYLNDPKYKLDTRGTERVMRRVYLLTIAYFSTHEEFLAFLDDSTLNLNLDLEIIENKAWTL